MQPTMVACPRTGIAPMTPYCGPGPERMLSGVIAEATVAAEAALDSAAATVMAAKKIVFLYCMIDLLLMLDACVRRHALARSEVACGGTGTLGGTAGTRCSRRNQNPTTVPCKSYSSAHSILTVAISPTRSGRRLATYTAPSISGASAMERPLATEGPT